MTVHSRTSYRGIRARSVARVGLVLIAVACSALAFARSGVPPVRARSIVAPHVIQITGTRYAWHVRYPGADGVLGTDDDVRGRRDLHVPAGVATRVLLRSRDYIYSLRVPSLDLNQVAIPAIDFELHIDVAEVGRHPLNGGQMCGITHPALQGTVVVESEEAYWAALRGMETP